LPAWARGLFVLALLYLFLTGVGLLSEGIEGLGSDVQERLFESVRTPIGGLFVGILATVLVQSSSVSTSTIVGLVATGLVSVGEAVPMIMGANIGTSVTNTLASVGSIRRPAEFRRAVGAATVHDFFNLLAVAVLLPLELLTGELARAAEWISETLVGSSGTTFKSPIKQLVEAPVGLLVDIAEATRVHGTALGIVMIAIGLGAIFFALAFITRNMRLLVADRFEKTLNRVLSGGSGIIAMLVGLVATVAVQSSSITTSVLVPIAAAGVITLQNVYPITLGANVGTTITALLASLATDRPEALTIAIVHTLFNLAGILVFYGIPGLRGLPIRLAETFAEHTADNRRLLPMYVLGTFVVVPLVGILILG
jgi:solute carrier family 34 (sodium-dependent phosphate cotransporter)